MINTTKACSFLPWFVTHVVVEVSYPQVVLKDYLICNFLGGLQCIQIGLKGPIRCVHQALDGCDSTHILRHE